MLAEGSAVDLAGAIQGEWQPVFCGGSNGFVHGSFVASGNVEIAPATEATTESDSAEVAVADQAVGGPVSMGMISGTNGDGVRCRASASYTSAIIGVLKEGADVSVRGSANGDWTPVTCFGTSGWVHSDFVSGGSTGTQAAVNDWLDRVDWFGNGHEQRWSQLPQRCIDERWRDHRSREWVERLPPEWFDWFLAGCDLRWSVWFRIQHLYRLRQFGFVDVDGDVEWQQPVVERFERIEFCFWKQSPSDWNRWRRSAAPICRWLQRVDYRGSW